MSLPATERAKVDEVTVHYYDTETEQYERMNCAVEYAGSLVKK